MYTVLNFFALLGDILFPNKGASLEVKYSTYFGKKKIVDKFVHQLLMVNFIFLPEYVPVTLQAKISSQKMFN